MTTKKTIILLWIALGGVLMESSCTKDHDNDNNYKLNNQDFVNQATSGNMFEIAAGNLAIKNSTNATVIAFGYHMITDHGQTATDMATLATSKGWTIPAVMSEKEQTNYNALAALSGTAFDKQFANIMVTSHQQTISLFESAGSDNGVPDGDLRGFAAGELPTLKEHLADAQTLQTAANLE
jgi:putative membrane protein